MFFVGSSKSKHLLYMLCSVVCIVLGGTLSARLVNLTDAREKVEHYYECGKYDKDMDKIVAKAMRHFKKVPVSRNSLVVFDIDDTLLSNYCQEKAVLFRYDSKLYHEFILQAKMPAIAQAKRLYDYLVCRGFRIMFLSWRKYNEYDATIKNLKEQGFCTFDRLILGSPEEKTITAQEFKTNRRRLLEKAGYHIVGMIGDQCSDLVGHADYMVKFPNYRYRID